MIKSFFNENQIIYEENPSLKKYNTYRLDAKCKYLVFPKDELELINILKEIKKDNLKYLMLGNGSNTIFKNDYYDGIIIKLDRLNKITYNSNYVTAEAGCSLMKLSLDLIKHGLSGLEFGAAIPGDVGASTAMNAGAYTHDMAEVVDKVRVLDKDLNIKEFTNSELEFEYRDSYLKKHPEYIVIYTTFKLTRGDRNAMSELISTRRVKRLATQPLDKPSAGSVFRNPEGMFAGELIEKCGLKGYKIGGAEVSKKHANFIINSGNAKGEDIVKLIEEIKKIVKKEYNVDLVLEQIIVE